MIAHPAKRETIDRLRKELLAVERRHVDAPRTTLGLGSIEQAFADRIFPTGAIHECISYSPEAAAATNGFIAAIGGRLLAQGGACLWVSTTRTLFPPTLKPFGINPSRVIFIDITRNAEALWAMEEGLHCKALTVVVGEIPDLTFNQSRRLQLAVEESHVTGFLHRQHPRIEGTVASVSRWKINPIGSAQADMPGPGLPRWHIELVKVRNGKPAVWDVEWSKNGFCSLSERATAFPTIQTRKAG